jgi:hypothetical protein
MITLGNQSVAISSVLHQLARHPDTRARLGDLLQRPLGSGPATNQTIKERINDRPRLQRMVELILQGTQKHPAARQACSENFLGASLEACERRLVRKYNDRLDPRRLP